MKQIGSTKRIHSCCKDACTRMCMSIASCCFVFVDRCWGRFIKCKNGILTTGWYYR